MRQNTNGNIDQVMLLPRSVTPFPLEHRSIFRKEIKKWYK